MILNRSTTFWLLYLILEQIFYARQEDFKNPNSQLRIKSPSALKPSSWTVVSWLKTLRTLELKTRHHCSRSWEGTLGFALLVLLFCHGFYLGSNCSRIDMLIYSPNTFQHFCLDFWWKSLAKSLLILRWFHFSGLHLLPGHSFPAGLT